MKTKYILEELREAAAGFGLEVRMEKGNFRGGRCKIADEEIIVLNKQHLPEEQLVVLANSLRGLPIDDIFLKPSVRAAVEEIWRQREPAELYEADDTE